jgi:citrate lyase subunit beta/citryl-CoA lyase
VSPEQALELHLCLDTGRGNWDAVGLIQASPRVQSISLGRADLVMDLRQEPSGDLHLMPYLMQRLIIIANATGVQPIGAWWRATSRGLMASHDDTLTAAFTGRQAGFKGALCLQAQQVAALNQGFTPTTADIAHATAVLDTWADGRGRGVFLDGAYIDAAQAAIATNLLTWATACEGRERGRATALAHLSAQPGA